jgi:hypothetical protein
MAVPVPKHVDDPANPLQPGDPFKRGNFNRFALGMCLFIALFLVVAIAYFLLVFRKHQSTPAPSPSSRSALVLPSAITA